MVGDEPRSTMTSTTTAMKATSTTGTHRARYQERRAGGTAVNLLGVWSPAETRPRCEENGPDWVAFKPEPGVRTPLDEAEQPLVICQELQSLHDLSGHGPHRGVLPRFPSGRLDAYENIP